MDLEKGIYAGLALLVTGFVGKWLVPLLMRMLDNSVASATASGGALATITAERDQWKLRAIDLDRQLQEMRADWASMKGDMRLIKYQLHEARVRIAQLTGDPPPAIEDEIGGDHGQSH